MANTSNEASSGAESVKKRSLKQQIRDTKRLLAKEDLPETVRLTKERVLKSLQGELNDKATERHRQRMAKNYRMVKFFDRRKVVRRLKQACTEYSKDSLDEASRAELRDTILQLRLELNYTIHFPPGEKYVALYPSSTPSSKRALAKQEEVLQSIAESVEKGLLPDSALLEKKVSIPPELIGGHSGGEATEVKGKAMTVPLPEIHKGGDEDKRQVRDQKKGLKGKKRKPVQSEDEGSSAEEGWRKKLRQDEFFLAPTS